MSIPTRTKRFVSISIFTRLQTLIFISQRSNHTIVGNGEKAQFHRKNGLDSVPKASGIDSKKWKIVDSRKFGIDSSIIPEAPWMVLKLLRKAHYEAYLVGGCVRDLILRRTPKDFDVITNADLDKIKKIFNRAPIVGRRFPICWVHIKGSIVEVSSFHTVAKQDKKKKADPLPEMPTGCNKEHFERWKNSLGRDFTINSLFYNPFANKIYDYANGMRDLEFREVRTVTNAKDSFKEDCARILRGLRIAARLGLSFSKDTETAIQNHSASIKDLDKGRLMMEMNYMFSYGAAESSICLLGRFKLLDILFPFHAAYLAVEAPVQSAQSSLMLMKLFSSMDKLLACDRPCHCSLWVALLSFHLALVNNPQNALVIWAFASVLYHGNWEEAVHFARENAQMRVKFVPEISEASGTTTDEALVEDVMHFASLVRSSFDALTDPNSQYASLARYSSYPCTGSIFISKKVGQNVAGLFDVLATDLKSYNHKRKSFEIDYWLLGKGDRETRFVLGKVIMDTMSSGVIQEQQQEAVEEHHLPPSYVKKQTRAAKEKNYLEEFNLAVSNLEQQQDGLKEENADKLVSLLGEGQKVVEKKKRHPRQGNLGGQREPDKKGKYSQPMFNPEQQQEVVKEEKVAEKKKSYPKQGNLGGQREPDKKGNLGGQREADKKVKYSQPMFTPEQQQEVVKEEVKHRKPLSSLFCRNHRVER